MDRGKFNKGSQYSVRLCAAASRGLCLPLVRIFIQRAFDLLRALRKKAARLRISALDRRSGRGTAARQAALHMARSVGPGTGRGGGVHDRLRPNRRTRGTGCLRRRKPAGIGGARGVDKIDTRQPDLPAFQKRSGGKDEQSAHALAGERLDTGDERPACRTQRRRGLVTPIASGIVSARA